MDKNSQLSPQITLKTEQVKISFDCCPHVVAYINIYRTDKTIQCWFVFMFQFAIKITLLSLTIHRTNVHLTVECFLNEEED